MIEKLHDKSCLKIQKQLQPMSVQIKELLSKQGENIQNEHPFSDYNFEI